MSTTSDSVLPHVTLYWLDKSRAQRIVWLLEECKGLTYSIEVFKRGQDKLAPPELKKIHPLGKSPVIKIKSGNREVTLAESGTIVEYLCQHFCPQLVPTKYKPGHEGEVLGETDEWLRYAQLIQYAEGSLMAVLVTGVVIDGIRNAPVPFFAKPLTRGVASRVDESYLTRNYENHFEFLEGLLTSEYFCGDRLTAVDILLSFPVLAGSNRFGYDKYPKLKAYAERIRKLPVYQRSIEVIEKRTGETFVENL